MQYSPGIISVLPLFYVGWSDSVLGPSELKQIRLIIQNMDFLTDHEKNTLVSWANPENPPSEDTFKQWISILAEYSSDLDDSKKHELAELGIEIATIASGNRSHQFNTAKTKEAIVNLSRALRVDNQFSKNNFYQRIFPNLLAETKLEQAFDPLKIQSALNGKYGAVVEKVKNLIQDKAFDVPFDLRDKELLRQLILEQCHHLAEQGLGAHAYPVAYGGKNQPAASSAIFEGLAMGNLSLLIKFGVQFGLFGGAILQLGSKYHHDTYLQPTGALDLAGCFAMTETGHGSNVKDLETTATYNHEKGTLTIHSPSYKAGKEYIGNALHSKMAAVFVQLIVAGKNHGIHAVLVPLRDQNHNLLPGVDIKDCGYKIGLNGVDNGRIWFNQVEVPVKNLLDKFGGINTKGEYYSAIEKPSKRFFTMLGALVGGRVSIAIGANTAAKKALVIATKYALKRRQFSSVDEAEETLIMDYPTHQDRLFPLIAKSYSLTFALENLRLKFEETYGKDDIREVESLAAGLKAYASWHATHAIQTCREACGGKGYLSENEIGDLKADTDIFTTFEGDNTVLMQLVAKALLTEFKQEFHDGGYLAIAKNVLRRVAARVVDQNPITVRNTNAEHILSHDFMSSAFAFREQKLMFSLSDRMRSFMGKKVNPNEIFLRVQTHMVVLANAHIEHFIYKQNYEAVQKATGKEKDALQLMLNTFALTTIYADRGWYLENDFINGDKSKAILKIINGLYHEIRPQVELFVDAFGIPNKLLKANIINDDRMFSYTTSKV